MNIPLHNFTDSKVGFSWAKQAKLMTKTSVLPIDILEFGNLISFHFKMAETISQNLELSHKIDLLQLAENTISATLLPVENRKIYDNFKIL